MLLSELAGVKQFAQLKPADAIQRLNREFDKKRTTLKPLGKGSNAVALTDGQSVFKFWLQDRGYESFVEVALKNQDDPYFPKFKSKIRTIPKLLKIEGVPQNIRYIKMELLKPFSGPENIRLFLDPEMEKKVGGRFSNQVSFHNIFLMVSTGQRLKRCIDRLLDNHQSENDIKFSLQGYHDKVNPELIKMLEPLIKINDALRGHDQFDYAPRNLALRGTQIVFLDPVSNQQDLDINDQLLDLNRFNLRGET